MITRAHIRRQLRASGGITNAVPRQGYFLGKIVKGIGKGLGKVVDVAKQVVKSPIGKAALIGLGGAGLMGLGGPFAGLSGLGARIGGGLGALKTGLLGGATLPPSMGFKSVGLLGKLGLTKGGGSMGLTGLGKMLGAGGLIGYFASKGASEEEAKELAQDVYRGKGIGFDQIRADLNKYRSGELSQRQMFDKNYRFLTPRNFVAAQGGRVGLKEGTKDGTVGIESLRLGEYDMEGFQNKGKGNTLTFGSDDLKRVSQSLESGKLSNLSPRQKEKIREKILLARAGILNPTELMNEIGTLQLTPDAEKFLKTVTPDKTIEKVFLDKEGDFRKGFQKMRALGESAFFGGQKNPTQLSQMYNKLGDKYIEDQKKAIQREIDFNREYGDVNYLNFEEGGSASLAMDKENVKQKFVSDEAGAIPKKGGGVLPSDIGKLRRSDFDTDEDYQRYLRQLNRKAMGGIMNMPMGNMRRNRAGVMERDYRDEGGFVPVGVKEKADDVPAMLSKNEFVMTADAVRGAGDGNIKKGAQRMYDLMKRNEGKVV